MGRRRSTIDLEFGCIGNNTKCLFGRGGDGGESILGVFGFRDSIVEMFHVWVFSLDRLGMFFVGLVVIWVWCIGSWVFFPMGGGFACRLRETVVSGLRFRGGFCFGVGSCWCRK